MEGHTPTILLSLSRGVSEMDINSTAAVGLRASRRAAKTIALISVVTCAALTGFAAAVHGFTEAPATQPVTAVGGDEVPARSVACRQSGRPRANARTGRC